MLADYAVLNEEALVPMPSHLSFEESRDIALRRRDRLGGANRSSACYCRRYGADARIGRRFGLRAPIRSAPRRPRDRHHVERRKSRAA